MLWTRYLKQKRRLQAAEHINPVFIGKLRDYDLVAKAMDTDYKLLRTVVCQQDHVTLALSEALARLARPFVIVIDATPWGVRDFVVEVVEQMAVYFPEVPRLLLVTTGDQETRSKLVKYDSELPVWGTGRSDQVLFGHQGNARWAGRLVLIPDSKLDNRLCSVYRQLKILENEVKAPVHKEVHSSLLRVWRVVVNMLVPIQFHEICTVADRRGGLYPIRPIEDELRMARKVNMPSGASQSAKNQACEEIQALVDFLSSGTSGKTQALHRWVDETLDTRQKGLIAAGSGRDAGIIRRYLLEKYHQAIVNRQIQIVSAKGVDDLYRFNSEVNRVFIGGEMWKSDYWIAGLGKDFTWVNYPIQKDYAKRCSHGVRYVDRCSSDDEKIAWWTYRKGRAMAPPEALDCELWRDCAGQYDSKEEFPLDYETDESWMLRLMEDLDWRDPPLEEINCVIPDRPVTIYTAQGTHCFDENQGIELFDTEKQNTRRVRAYEVKPGDTIIFHTHDTADSELLDTIMEAVYGTSSSELQLKRDIASQWHPMLHSAMKKYGDNLSRLERKLSVTGVSQVSLKQWLSDQHPIDKNTDTIIPAVAKLAGEEYSDAVAKKICQSIGELHDIRSHAGCILYQTRLASAKGKNVITVNKMKLSIDILSESVHFEEVKSVDLPEAAESEESEERDWIAEVSAIADGSAGRLTITPAAKKSMQDSLYKDRNRAVHCIRLLLSELYPVYFGDNSLDGAIATLKRHGITFRGSMAETTQGKFKYVYKSKFYNGRRADLSKHIRIGNSHSQERCFCVHFEVDKDDGVLVVHHAGAHLKTSKD